MTEFFFDYGLFTAKTLTVILALLVLLLGVAIIVASRQRETESIEIEKLNDKFDTLKEALEVEILSKEEIKALKKERKKKDKLEAKQQKQRLKEGINEPLRPRLFVLRFNGDMHASEVDNMREAITAILSVAKTENKDEVLIILESPGGLVHNYGLAASQLQRFRERNIPLTASIDLVAASGGYMMACVANNIIAAPFAVVGSIGVLAQIPNFNRLLKKYDIDVEQHTAGEYKTTLTMFGENTDKAREKFQEELEDTHVLFKEFVQIHRPQLNIEKLATGEHWYGTQAIELKLVDQLITSDDYLLNKNDNTDIYEVSYVIQESLTDKITHVLHGVAMKVFRKFFPMRAM